MNCSGIGLVGNCGVSSVEYSCLKMVGSRVDLCSMLADICGVWYGGGCNHFWILNVT